MSHARFFDHVALPSAFIEDRLKPADEKERALLDARLNVELVEEFKKIDIEFEKLKSSSSFRVPDRVRHAESSAVNCTNYKATTLDSADKPRNDLLHYASLVRKFKKEVLGHPSYSQLDPKILDLVLVVNKAHATEVNEQAVQDILQKKAELEKALEYAIEQRKLWLVYQVYNEWKYPPNSSSNWCNVL